MVQLIGLLNPKPNRMRHQTKQHKKRKKLTAIVKMNSIISLINRMEKLNNQKKSQKLIDLKDKDNKKRLILKVKVLILKNQ